MDFIILLIFHFHKHDIERGHKLIITKTLNKTKYAMRYLKNNWQVFKKNQI